MLKKELFIFIAIFLFLALGMHMTQWLSHPIEHLHNLAKHKMPYHPLLYTSLLYFVVGLVRLCIYALSKFFKKN